MKKISSFIPKHVVNKKDIISNIQIILKHISTHEIKDDFQYQPLILGAWEHSDKSKNDRFKLQLKLSYKKNTFDKVYLYLQKLDLNKDFLRNKFPLSDFHNFDYTPYSSHNMIMFKEKMLLTTIRWVHLLLKSSKNFGKGIDADSFANILLLPAGLTDSPEIPDESPLMPEKSDIEG